MRRRVLNWSSSHFRSLMSCYFQRNTQDDRHIAKPRKFSTCAGMGEWLWHIAISHLGRVPTVLWCASRNACLKKWRKICATFRGQEPETINWCRTWHNLEEWTVFPCFFHDLIEFDSNMYKMQALQDTVDSVDSFFRSITSQDFPFKSPFLSTQPQSATVSVRHRSGRLRGTPERTPARCSWPTACDVTLEPWPHF